MRRDERGEGEEETYRSGEGWGRSGEHTRGFFRDFDILSSNRNEAA